MGGSKRTGMYIRLSHHKVLGYPAVSKRTALPVSPEARELQDRGATLITFRPPAAGRPDQHLKRLTAVDRFTELAGRDLVLYGVETDSPLAPLILWDLVHAMPVDGTLTLLGDTASVSYIERSYFKNALQLVESAPMRKVFRKVKPLPAEADEGLDAWTFGIPVGPEDATLLNRTVERILQLDVPQKEIVLCGRPGANFKYFDQVRIVGEDITAPPVKICAKKNRLVAEASHPNVCIIHDRVFLPTNFGEAVRSFGDFYPLTAFQSLWFDDRFNMVPRRYSDFGVSHRAKANPGKGIPRNNDVDHPSVFAPGVLPLTEMSGFYVANVLRHSHGVYPTGSLYLCKRSVWRAFPQNENLHWIEFEDLEHAYRANDGGVPSVINPYAVTQTLISRPLLCRSAGTFIERARGSVSLWRPWMDRIPLPRKPAIKVTQEAALKGLRRFAEKYVPSLDPVSIPASSVILGRQRIETIIDILSRCEVPLRDNVLRQFVSDFERWVVFDQLPFSWVESVIDRLLNKELSLVQVLVLENENLRNHLAIRPRRNTFCFSLDDYLQPRSPLLFAGSLFSALALFMKRRRVIYVRGGPLAYLRAIVNTTPFRTGAA